MKNAQQFFNAKDSWTLDKLPRIMFIEPIVVELHDKGIEKNILVERFLEGTYLKWNSNMGFVEGEVKRLVDRRDMLGLGEGGLSDRGLDDLGAIEEGSEESEDEAGGEEEDVGKNIDDICSAEEAAPESGDYRDFQDAYFPQAFSHFTYEKSGGNLMVVDLQGVFTIKDDGSRCYELTGMLQFRSQYPMVCFIFSDSLLTTIRSGHTQETQEQGNKEMEFWPNGPR